jgi:hypothetical protein
VRLPFFPLREGREKGVGGKKGGVKGPNMNKIIFICCLLATAPFARELSCPGVKALRIAQCGGATLEVLQKQWDQCDMASRLLSFAQLMDSLAVPCSTQVIDVKKRYAFFEDTVRFPIDLKEVPCAGAADAPLRIVLYVSMSCPVCKWLYSALSDSLKNGRMKGMSLYVKPFSASPLEHILAAFQKEHRQDELLRALAPVKERVSAEMMLRIADSLGMPREKIEKLSRGGEVVAWVAASRAEALRNGATATPAVFIGGKSYRSNKNPRWVIDAARFELGKLR